MPPSLRSYVVAVLPPASEHTLGALFRLRDGANPETLHLTVGLVPTGYAWLQLAGDADLDAHAALTAAHGATGAVVGTTNAQTLTNKTLTSPAITTPTGIVKGDVGLGNVDNTSDATKDAAVATLANKTLTAPTIGDFANANHLHAGAASGGQVLHLDADTTADQGTGTGTTYATVVSGTLALPSGTWEVVASWGFSAFNTTALALMQGRLTIGGASQTPNRMAAASGVRVKLSGEHLLTGLSGNVAWSIEVASDTAGTANTGNEPSRSFVCRRTA